MQIYDKDKLCDELLKMYDFGYSDKNMKDYFIKAFNQHVLNRIKFLYEKSSHIIIEKEYVETEWKEMISYHYINTTYYNQINNRVIRIHFLNSNVLSENNYLGHITLRPVPELRVALSFVYLNWSNTIWKHDFFDSEAHVMTYKKYIHIDEYELIIDSYPLFSQDSIVTCCADANILMLSKYMSHKYSFKKLRISDIRHSFFDKRFLPRTVDETFFENILVDNGIPFKCKEYINPCSTFQKEHWEILDDMIKAYVESELPVIIGFNGHVVQVIGYCDGGNYIIYDDSGYLNSQLANENIDGEQPKCFCYSTNITRIKDCLQENSVHKFFVGICEHERVYLEYSKYRFHVINYINYYYNKGLIDFAGDILDMEKTLPGCQSVHPFADNINVRTLLVSTSILKQHLSNNCLDWLQEALIKPFIESNTPHYVWFTEIEYNDKEVLCTVADPTRYYHTDLINELFFEIIPFPMNKEKRLKTLT